MEPREQEAKSGNCMRVGMMMGRNLEVTGKEG